MATKRKAKSKKTLEKTLRKPKDPESKRKTLLLISKNGGLFKVGHSRARISTYIRKKIEEDEKLDRVDLPKIDTPALKLIVDYLRKRDGDDIRAYPMSITEDMKENCLGHSDRNNAWCAEFINKASKNRKVFFDMIEGAEFLDIKGLVILGVTKLAHLLKYCRTEDIDRVLDPNIMDGKLLPMRDFEAGDNKGSSDEENDDTEGESKNKKGAKDSKKSGSELSDSD